MSLATSAQRTDRRLWLLLAPFAFGVVALLVLPMLATFGYAFTDHTGLRPPQFNGLANVRRMLHDPFFTAALRASLIHAAITVPLRVAAATGVALLLAAPRRGGRLYRAGVYLPTVIPDVALALLFLWVLNPLYGPLNHALGLFGVTGPNWLAEPWSARFGVALMMLLPIGEGFLVVLAARRSVPAALYEAAGIDGASSARQLWSITLPSLAPLLLLLTVRDLAMTLQTSFVPGYILTDGKPGNATLYLPLYAYDQSFEFLGFGYGALITIVLMAITGVLIALMLRIGRRWVRAY